uniref:Uncharacterized protein n=1 Tax=Avena sativa TaxID=4498 RepID=A0ACD5YR47_AVESA
MMGARANAADCGEYAEVDPTGRYGRYSDVLGKGASKTVYRAFDEYQGMEVAWNQVKLHDFLQSPEDLERLYCEIHLLKTLKHKNIMKFYTSWVDVSGRNINFITEMFTSGTLRQYRQKHRKVNLWAVKHWCRQILSGLLYLHSHDPPIIHRDLKCDNIFVNGNQGEVKIGDLGLAAILRKSHAVHCVGTPEFMAPEVYEEEYNELVDIYSFGMCVLEMVTFEYPYSECSHPVQIYKRVISGTKPEALYKVNDPLVRQFVEKCLTTASRRLPARELLNDPFLRIDDMALCSGDGDYSQLNSYLRQPYLGHAYSNGSMISNGLSESIDEDTPTEDRWDCEDDDTKADGIDLFNGHEDEALGTVDITIKGRKSEDGGIFLRLRITDDDGRVRNIYFPFDIENDTALSVATEMVGELDITDHEVTRIADMIDGEVSALVPDWMAGPGIEEAPDTTYCHNCGSNVSSCGSLFDYMSSATRGCRCAELHGRFEEITFQAADEDQSGLQDSGGSSDDVGGQREQHVKDKEPIHMNGFPKMGRRVLSDRFCFSSFQEQSCSANNYESDTDHQGKGFDIKHEVKMAKYKARKMAQLKRAIHPSLDLDNSNGTSRRKPALSKLQSFHVGKHHNFRVPTSQRSPGPLSPLQHPFINNQTRYPDPGAQTALRAAESSSDFAFTARSYYTGAKLPPNLPRTKSMPVRAVDA